MCIWVCFEGNAAIAAAAAIAAVATAHSEHTRSWADRVDRGPGWREHWLAWTQLSCLYQGGGGGGGGGRGLYIATVACVFTEQKTLTMASACLSMKRLGRPRLSAAGENHRPTAVRLTARAYWIPPFQALGLSQDFKNACPKQQFQNFCRSRFCY